MDFKDCKTAHAVLEEVSVYRSLFAMGFRPFAVAANYTKGNPDAEIIVAHATRMDEIFNLKEYGDEDIHEFIRKLDGLMYRDISVHRQNIIGFDYGWGGVFMLPKNVGLAISSLDYNF